MKFQNSKSKIENGSRLFWEVAKRSMNRQLTYRVATLAGLSTNFFFGMIHMGVYTALHTADPTAVSLDQQQVITYTAIMQGAMTYLHIFGSKEVMQSVYSGEVAADLLKPMNYFLFWMAKDFGRALVAFVLRGVVIVAGYALFFSLSWPSSVQQWALFGLTAVLSWLISFSYRFLVNLAAFWTPNAIGMGRFFFGFSTFLSGFMMPMPFLPDWLVRFAYATPFPYIADSLVQIFLGEVSGTAALQLIALQAMWVVVLVIIAQLVLKAAVRRLVILGG